MKTSNLLLLTTATLALGALRLGAQPLIPLHTFSGPGPSNQDGAGPSVELLLSGNTLYGAAGGGANGSGPNNFGTVFSLGTDGNNFTVLHLFSGVTATTNVPSNYLNTDGIVPEGNLVLSGNTIFGTATGGGTNGSGTIFAVTTDGWVFSVLHTFATNVPMNMFVSTNVEGAYPDSLVLSGDTLYGTAKFGGTSGLGTVFSINTNGTGYTVLHTFKPSDGANPQSTLVLSGNTLYGATQAQPLDSTSGTVYSVTTNGSSFSVLHTLPGNGATSSGAYITGLILSGNTLFGTMPLGGTNDTGSIFSISTGGGAVHIIYTFSSNVGSNLDGAGPQGALMLVGDTLYGTANQGGAHHFGTVFSVNTNGTGLNTIYSFTTPHSGTNLDGSAPRTGVVLSGATLYGTAYFGGNGNGTVFSLPVAPAVTNFSFAGTNLTLRGINNVAGHALTVLTSTNAAQPVNQWTPVATNVPAGGGNFGFTATNAVVPSNAQQFFMLQTH